MAYGLKACSCHPLIVAIITRLIFINILQDEHFSAVKFAMDYGKNDLSCDTKISKMLENSWKYPNEFL